MSSIKKIYLSIIIVGVLSILSIVFVVMPLFKGIKEISQKLLLEKNKIIYLNEERKNFQNIKRVYETYQADLDRLENLFVDPAIPIEFINFLEKSATTSQIKLEISSMTKKQEKGEAWPSLYLQLSATGSFSNFLKFLEKIENGPYLIEILDLNTRKLTEKEREAKELGSISGVDTVTIFSIKVFTK